MNRDPRLLIAVNVLALLLWALAGCAHHESQRSRDVLECIYNVQFVGPRLSPAAEAAAVERCHAQ